MDKKTPRDLLTEWQQIVDLIAFVAKVPVGLIMELRGDDLSVLVSSATQGNPYCPGEEHNLLGSGLYCEEVITSQQMLLVPNALKSGRWNANPDLELGMLAYLGFPLRRADGGIFGTICLLDSRENTFSQEIITLVEKMRMLIEGNLKIHDLLSQNARRAAEIDKKNSELCALNAILAESEKKLRFITENTADTIWVYNVDKEVFVYVNPGSCLHNMNIDNGLPGLTLQDVVTPEFLDAMSARIRNSASRLRQNPDMTIVARHEAQFIDPDGRVIWVEYNARYLLNSQGHVEIVGVSRNIDERKRREQDIYFLSTHDHLTRVFNRSYLFAHGATIIEQTHLSREPVSMLFFDLDFFKLVNDRHGHAVGDDVLKRTASAVEKCLKTGDVLARYGGEEFVVLLPGANLSAACVMAKKISMAVKSEPMPHLLIMTLSIGVTEKLPQESLDDWISRTDKTMYAAKKAGRDCFVADSTSGSDA